MVKDAAAQQLQAECVLVAPVFECQLQPSPRIVPGGDQHCPHSAAVWCTCAYWRAYKDSGCCYGCFRLT